MDYVGTARGRLGYATGHVAAYVTGGFAWAGERFLNTPAVGSRGKAHQRPARLGRRRGLGICLRAALERAARISLQPVSNAPTFDFRIGHAIRPTMDFQSMRVGLNRKVDWPGSPTWKPKTDLTDPESDRWEIHGQTTYLRQGYPALPRAL